MKIVVVVNLMHVVGESFLLSIELPSAARRRPDVRRELIERLWLFA